MVGAGLAINNLLVQILAAELLDASRLQACASVN